MTRLDVLISKKLNISRDMAKNLIINGKVTVNNIIALKPGKLYSALLNYNVELPSTKYVSRGGYKLESAISNFNISVKNTICLDIGSSTGGFTDCLLQHGAKIIYAVDVGSNQLNKSIKNNPQIVSLENTDIRNLNLPLKSDIVTVDVSFISLTLVLPKVFTLLKHNAYCIALIKPQFEAGKKFLNKKGIITNPSAHKMVLKKIEAFANNIGLEVLGNMQSPIVGKEGNIEFFCCLKKPLINTVDCKARGVNIIL